MTVLLRVLQRARENARRLLGDATRLPGWGVLHYRLTASSKDSRRRTLLYRPKRAITISLKQHPRDDTFATYSLRLPAGLVLELVASRCPALSGFSLSVRKPKEDAFSWNWFTRGEPGCFYGRTGTQLLVELTQRPDLEDIRSITFVHDTMLRVAARAPSPSPVFSDEIEILSGSVLRVPLAPTDESGHAG